MTPPTPDARRWHVWSAEMEDGKPTRYFMDGIEVQSESDEETP